MDAVDGNALAGALHEAFGSEMTMATGICRTCRRASLIAELRVYSLKTTSHAIVNKNCR